MDSSDRNAFSLILKMLSLTNRVTEEEEKQRKKGNFKALSLIWLIARSSLCQWGEKQRNATMTMGNGTGQSHWTMTSAYFNKWKGLTGIAVGRTATQDVYTLSPLNCAYVNYMQQKGFSRCNYGYRPQNRYMILDELGGLNLITWALKSTEFSLPGGRRESQRDTEHEKDSTYLAGSEM